LAANTLIVILKIMVFNAKSVDEYFLAQDLSLIEETMSKSKIVLEEIISKIKPGKKESDLYEIAKEIYLDHGIQRSWHNPYIRFGENTTLSYADKSSTDITLKEDDIAFVDIGPIFGDIEGDLGRTICFGENKAHKNIVEASESLFEQGLKFFKEKNPTGVEMQKFIELSASKMGYQFILKSCGHLLGLFSHGACWNKGIAEYDGKMQAGVWILEIHIVDPKNRFGAFYENLLC
jgi:Xaa-Pro aminopeptidase